MLRGLLLLVVFGASLDAAQISEALRQELELSPTVYALVLLSGAEPARISSLQQEVSDRNALAGRVTYRWSVLPGFSVLLDAEAISKLARDPDVAAIDLDLPGGASLVESRALVGADPVYHLGHTGAGVTVAVGP